MSIPSSSTLRQNLPPDVIELLRRLAMGGWKSDNEAYITQAAQGLCAAYGIPINSTTPTDYFAYTGYLDRNTAALVEWLDEHWASNNRTKVLVALLGNLSEERAQYHFDLLIRAKRDEKTWSKLISRTEAERSEHYMPISDDMQRQSRPETPKTKTISWMKEQLRRAKNVTYALARQAVAEGILLGTPGAQE